MICGRILLLLVFWTYPRAASAQVDSTPVAGAAAGVLPAADHPDYEFHREDDSLQLKLIELEEEKLRLEAEHSNLWHRLIPALHFTASLGWKDVIFIDPATLAPSILPKDAYRITIGISLADILDDSKHAAAELMLKKTAALSSRLLLHDRQQKMNRDERQQKLAFESEAIREERDIVQEEVRFNEMRFRQGKIDYDVLLKSKLRLIDLRTRLRVFGLEARNLQLKPSTGDSP